jgi:hypothetical protein
VAGPSYPPPEVCVEVGGKGVIGVDVTLGLPPPEPGVGDGPGDAEGPGVTAPGVGVKVTGVGVGSCVVAAGVNASGISTVIVGAKSL